MSSAIRTLLTDTGYGLAIRRDGFVECLASRGSERWVGKGLDEDEALADVLRQMAPSALAWELVARALVPTATPDAPVTTTPAPAEIAVAETIVMPPPAEANAATPGAPVATVEAIAKVEPAPVTDGPRLKRSAAPPAPALPLRKIDEDLAELQVLEERLMFMLPELAMLSRDLQRMGFIAFIGRARHIGIRAQDARVDKVVQRIAGRLGELAQQLWPGSVRALQLKSTPLQAGADLGLPDGGKLHDWDEAAEHAERLLEEQRALLDQKGLDEYGWADAAACLPAPNDADLRLEQVRHAMEKFFGQLDRPAATETDRELQMNASKLLPDLQRWAKELRWLRPHVEDRLPWGQAMGRLRWAATRLAKEARETLNMLLDEDYRPPKTWPTELGEDPVAKQKKKQRSALLKRKPDANVAATDLAGWLSEAFELGDAFTTTEIAERVTDLAEPIARLPADEATGADRKFRRRLKLLQDELQFRMNGGSEVTPDSAASGDANGAGELGAEPDEGDLAFRRLLESVRGKVEGKTALFVSNRADPPLKDKLERELGLTIEWAEIDPRRLQARIESVRQRSYDLVLSATGFQGHRVDSTLGRESRAAEVPYVRVNRGRLTTCVRAIARQFGLLEAA